MRLLITAQVVDTKDPVLGFFHRWISELATQAESIEVICLKRGEYALPHNVRVHSLGKEHGAQSRLVYIVRFITLAWKLKNEYDTVFVHMNQEYVLLAGWLWKLWRKKIYLWRNHHTGDFFTNIAAALCRKVFYTSRSSYTAQFPHAVRMPVGIDTELFRPMPEVVRTPRSILSLGRIAPQKHLDIIIEALAMLKDKDVSFVANIYGNALPEHAGYLGALKRNVREKGIADRVRFRAGVANDQTPAVYSAHEVFVNTSTGGMYDKTMLEALACGCTVVASSPDFAEDFGVDLSFQERNVNDLSVKLERALGLGIEIRQSQALQAHSLRALLERLREELLH